MHKNHYSDNELHQMSYQDLRKLSTLLQLPANIKKKYMISMIQAHQKGDGCMKTAIANKILEERKVKRLSTKKQSKAFMMDSSMSSQQIPTDLSVSTQHEFETRFSYVAHYTSKDEISPGISRIIKQEAEVSRRNRSVLQQPRKSTRKISTVGRTEIMLPRNHSLTTLVRLMPQYERGFSSSSDYEAMSNSKNHFQDVNYNYHFHGEISNAVMPGTSHEMYRNEPYWHSREMYNNSLMPILSSLLTPNSVSISSNSYASQYESNNSLKGNNSFQGVYENYLKNNIPDSPSYQSTVTNSSTIIVNNRQMINENSGAFNINRGNYIYSKTEVDYDRSSTSNELNCQLCNKRNETNGKTPNENQHFTNYCSSRASEYSVNSQTPLYPNPKDVSQYGNYCYRAETKEKPYSVHRSFSTTPSVGYNDTEPNNNNCEALPQVNNNYESHYVEGVKDWSEPESENKKLNEKNNADKENFVDSYLTPQSHGSFLSEISDASTNFSTELNDKGSKNDERESCETSFGPQLSRCRFTWGHNKQPDIASDFNNNTSLPTFLSTFSTDGLYNRAYSVCRSSFTGTTETHLNPIMTCTHASQFSPVNSQSSQNNTSSSSNQIQRQWYYTYPESQTPLSVEPNSYAWNEFPNEMDNKMVAPNNNHNVQVVKCKTHGCHYVNSNSCD